MHLTPAPLADALLPALAAGAVIAAKYTIWPWVVTVNYTLRDSKGKSYPEQRIVVVMAPMSAAPDALDLMPDGATFLRADVFPATRFEDMGPDARMRYKEQYRAFLMHRKARAFGMEPDQMVPWEHYDPVMIDETVQRWAKQLGYWAVD